MGSSSVHTGIPFQNPADLPRMAAYNGRQCLLGAKEEAAKITSSVLLKEALLGFDAGVAWVKKARLSDLAHSAAGCGRRVC